MRFERRGGHHLLYIATDGQQAIYLPLEMPQDIVRGIVRSVKPGTPSRRRRIIDGIRSTPEYYVACGKGGRS